MNTNESQYARNSKIAHFPAAIREELRERLARGERSQRLVKWLTQKGGSPCSNQAESR
ncbi:MAG: hypothetical protein ABJF10_12195 [Chthoniobacter sp.]|uniref:hypothetical protein n=1 Tax=Chthoniobacter sp. TaxID=2510640 RepID=UPI0032A175E2